MVVALLALSTLLTAARPYDASHYKVEFRLGDEGAFDNKVTVTLKPSRATSEIELDAFGLAVKSATVGGQPATFVLKEDPATRTGTLTVKSAKPLPAGKEAQVEIEVSGKAGTAPEGLFTVANDDAGGLPYYFTFFEPNYAMRFFPCNDRPDDKATTEVLAVVDERYQVLSNGAKVKDETFAEGSAHLRRVHYRQEKPHPVYAVALAVGQFEEVQVMGDVPSTLWVPKGASARAFIATDFTTGALRAQEAFLGVKYPWVKYDQVAIPRFAWGGMENTSISFIRENGLVLEHKNHIFGRARITGLIAHELAHQWFGDLVTCKGWEDTWLNEGFATYLGAVAEEAYYGNDYVKVDQGFDNFVWYFRQEDGPRSHPLQARPGQGADTFDAISYAKGAQVLRMLETWLGRADMQKGLKAYLEKYAHGNATSDDFFAAVGAATKKDKELKPFKEAWLKKRGYPVLFPETSWSGSTLTIKIRQQPNHPDEKGPFVFKLPIVIHRESEPAYHEEKLLVMDKPEITVSYELPGLPQWIDWNKDGAALAKVNQASVSEQEWILAARSDPNPVWRMIAQLTLLGEMVNPDAAEEAKPSPAALGALQDALAQDPSPYVREAVLNRMAMSKWKRLPADFGKGVLELAKRPGKLPEDAFGLVKVRRAAMAVLGKIDYPEGRAYLLEEVVKTDTDLNFLEALASGTARIGDSGALATLGQAINAHKPRGYAYYKAAAGALGSVQNPEVVKRIRELLKANPGNAELVGAVLRPLWDNYTVKSSPEAALFVRDFVLEEKALSDEMRFRVLELLDEVKTKDAKEALTAIAEKCDSARLKLSAQKVLEKNFPEPPKAAPPKAEKAKGKKK
ncbi:MAG: M1 family metallopeptidase [Myxococcaceae bacterium]